MIPKMRVGDRAMRRRVATPEPWEPILCQECAYGSCLRCLGCECEGRVHHDRRRARRRWEDEDMERTIVEAAREQARLHTLGILEYGARQYAQVTRSTVPAALAAWLDGLDPGACDVRWDRDAEHGGLLMQVYEPESTLPRQLVSAGVGISTLTKQKIIYETELQLHGATVDGFKVTIRGYLGPCQLETYTETVTRQRLVCPGGADPLAPLEDA